uniref:Uncharacterized protein n=1 Tax=Tetranychus urticae TaxID=32264 RepID=T1KXE1_TETUR
MVKYADETALIILKRIQKSVSCAIWHNLMTKPMRNSEDICNCPKCNAAVNRNRLVQDEVICTTNQNDKDTSPLGKGSEDIDLDKLIEEAEAREKTRYVVNKGTKRYIENLNDPVETVNRPFVMPKTSTLSGSGKERELSPPSDKQASPSPKRPREPLNRKLSFEGKDRRQGLMSDSSDSEDRPIRSSLLIADLIELDSH